MFHGPVRTRRVLSGALLGVAAAALLASCDLGDEVLRPGTLIVVSRVIITSHADTVIAVVADSVQFFAEARTPGGMPVPSATIQWSSSNLDVATVDARGRVAALSVGFARIRARSGAIESDPVTLNVQLAPPVITSVEVSGSPQLNVGSMTALMAVARDGGGAPVAGATFTWSSSNENAATVNSSGVATGHAPGMTEIRATAASVTSAPFALEVVVPAPAFAADIQPLLHPTCTATNCHGGNFPQEGLDLRPVAAYAEIVNRQSSQFPALLLVEPGDPDNSYFYPTPSSGAAASAAS